MKIIVGLGNPGEKYKQTRHNAGFMVLDRLVKTKDLDWNYSKKFNAEIAKDSDTIFAKPSTFMNNSGVSVEAIMSFYKLLPKKMGFLKEKSSDLSELLVVVHDDLDIPLGDKKESINSRAAGHNGVQSIINYLKTKNFKRLRIGINSDRPEQMAGKDFVLGRFTNEEVEKINEVIKNILI